MKSRHILVISSSLLVLLLLIISCGTATPETSETPATTQTQTTQTVQPSQTVPEQASDMVKLTLTKLDGTAVENMAEKPQYGGELSYSISSDPTYWDSAYTQSPRIANLTNTTSELLQGDWTRGPVGTGETTWFYGNMFKTSLETGELAESWEMPDNSTIIFHIRKGVHWHDIPPVNGREFTAEDAAWSFERDYNAPMSYVYRQLLPEERLISARAIDKYTLELKVPSNVQGRHFLLDGDQFIFLPHEMVEQYGDMKDWKHACGSGPFILKDYVTSSSLTYVRNPNYYETDPLFPENHLPYIDSFKSLIINDVSTRMAALRTGKLDFMSRGNELWWEDMDSLMKTCPDLVFKQKVSKGDACYVLAGRMDKELPFNDIRVRRALNMAVNKQEMVDSYWNGKAMLYAYPWIDDVDHEGMYIPLQELPEESQELWEYNPDKAKQLLAEAGYPDGFKTEINCLMSDVDILSIIREYFLAVGVDMEIKPLETGVYNSLSLGRTHEEMIYKITKENYLPYKFNDLRLESFDNAAFFETTEIREAYNDVMTYLGKDDAKVTQIIHDITPAIIESAWGVWLPAPYAYDAWWPWIKNYEAQANTGTENQLKVLKYVWIDQSLKKSLGY